MNKIIDRIRKCLSLASNNNSPEEAAAAAAMAQELMFKHQIGESDLDLDDGKRVSEEVVDESILDDGAKRVAWKATLAFGIARAFGCTLYTDQSSGTGTKYQVVGLKSVVQTVGYMFLYLANEVEQLADAAWARETNKKFQSPRTWKNNFRMGAVNIISKRLQAQRAEQDRQVAAMVREANTNPTAAPVSTALALYKTDQERVTDKYAEVKKAKSLRSKRTRYSYNPSAYERGQAAGGNVSLGGGKGLGAPAKQVRS